MFAKRKSFNPKRRVATKTNPADIRRWVADVRYGGNPEHKKNPGDFGLTPPASPRRNKTLCDEAGVFKRAKAMELLKEGIRRGLVSEQTNNGYPQNVWAVSAEGIPFEAQLENAGDGTYHGYPMPEDDAFRDTVISKWEGAHE